MDRLSNINTLLAFVTVAREGSVSKAAEILNLTQPAVSYQIKRLSEETGIILFRRTATGLQITQDGSAILQKAQQVLTAMNDFRRSARQQLGRVAGTLKIATIVDPEFIRLGRLLSQLRDEFPGHCKVKNGRSEIWPTLLAYAACSRANSLHISMAAVLRSR